MANQDTEQSKFEARFNPKQEKLEYELNRENDSKEEEKDDIDFIFDNFVGGGRWIDSGQWILFAPIMVIAYTGLFPIFMHIYAAFEPKYRCFIPICENGNTSSKHVGSHKRKKWYSAIILANTINELGCLLS